MSLTAIDTPVLKHDLDASPRAAALLTGAGLVGVLSGSPARIALVPMGSGAAHVVSLSLDAPQELALLSRDVAVVRCGDGQLWGLTDLAGAARPKVVGGEARALFMRPSGESALAIRADGSATVLTASRSEIGARTITLRGTLRACDVGDTVTYVVFEGEGGGQFRIHPGNTPELGTSAKTTLPAEAKNLDQVRGGAGLSVVFKRGGSVVCLVTGSPSRLSSRMAFLDSNPVDMAVVDDGLLVAYGGGRVALYDPESLAGSGPEPLVPRSVVALAARGKPRLVLPGVAKTSAALWIATTSGEIFSAPLSRDAVSEPRPQPPPPVVTAAPPPPPAEDTRDAELAALRGALATATVREEEHAQALEEQGAGHARTVETLHAEHGRLLEEHHAERAQALEAVKAEHAQALEAVKAEHAQTLEAVKTEHAQTLEAVKAEHAQTLEAVKAEHAQTLEAVKAEHAQTLEAVKAEHARALEEQGAAHALAVEAMKVEHGQVLEARDAEHARALEALRAEHAVAVEAVKVDHARVLEARDAEHAGAVEGLKAEHARALSEQGAAHALAVEGVKAEHALAVEGVKAEHAHAVEGLTAEHARALSEQRTEHALAVEGVKAEHAHAVEGLTAEHARALSEQEERVAAAEREAGHRTEERDAALVDLATARREAAENAGRARAAEERTARHEQERAALAADLDQLRADLAEERARLDRDFVKWGGRTISLDGARSALDAMVSRAQSVLNRR
jgi:hypothetical protein